MTTLEKAILIRDNLNCRGISCINKGEQCPLYNGKYNCSVIDFHSKSVLKSHMDEWFKENVKQEMTLEDFKVGEKYVTNDGYVEGVYTCKALTTKGKETEVHLFRDTDGDHFCVRWNPESWEPYVEPEPEPIVYDNAKFYGYEGFERYMLCSMTVNYQDASKYIFRSVDGMYGANGIYDSISEILESAGDKLRVFDSKSEFLDWLKG